MSQCITEVRRLDPEFNLHIWLDEMKDDTIPHVIKSYLRMDDKALLEHLSEGAMAQVSAAIKVRRDEVRILCVCVCETDSMIIYIYLTDRQVYT
jgi:hypothetical protein